MPMRSTGNNLLKVRARALTALMPPLRLRLSEWDRKKYPLARRRVGTVRGGAALVEASKP